MMPNKMPGCNFFISQGCNAFCIRVSANYLQVVLFFENEKPLQNERVYFQNDKVFILQVRRLRRAGKDLLERDKCKTFIKSSGLISPRHLWRGD